MRFLQILCVITILFTPLVNYVKSNPSGISLHDAIKKNAISIDFDSNNKQKLLEDIIVLPNGDFDQIAAESMITRIEEIHFNILTKLADQQVKVKLFNGKLTDELLLSHLRGVVPKGWEGTGKTWDDVPGSGGSLLVAARIGYSGKGNGHGSVNLELHEIGHSVDRRLFQSISGSFKFKEIWDEEKQRLFLGRNYFLNHPEEYFAEAFAMYYLGEMTRGQLKFMAPKTYLFIKKLPFYENKQKNVIPHI